MSTQRDGIGGMAGQSPEYGSGIAERQTTVNAPGREAWSGNTQTTQKSEVPFMVQGAGRPGQPNSGQRSIFGNGGPNFTQMPTYTPVTRAPQQQQPAPQPAHNPPQSPTQNAYAQPPAQPHAAPSHPAPQAPQSYQPPQHQPAHQPQAYGGHQPQSYQPQAYPQAPQADRPLHSQPLPDLSDADPGFPDSIFGDLTAASASADASFPESYSDQGAEQAFDASFLEQGGDASFPEPDFTAGHDAGHDDALTMGDELYGAEASFEPHQAQPAYQPQAQPHAAQPQAPASDPRRQLQAFDAVYDQPPQISLGAPVAQNPNHQAPQQFYETDRSDADFLDESQVLPPPARSKMAAALRGRSAFMVASALLGAIALGGAIAYAYKLSGGGLDGEAPLVTADASPVKSAPDQPGGKEFPHKNKLIYDRLTNSNEPESERIVPRQEDVAVPAMPPSTETAGLPAPVASTDLTNPATTQSVGGEEDGGPRKVKTLRVLPDGSVETPPAEAAAADAAGADAVGADATADAASPVMPVPAAQAAQAEPQQVAAADPAPAAQAPAANAKYVVQVGAKKNQTDALATFADIQQKYPDLLANYRPIVQKADLGSKGVWYRLRVGPIDDKSEAYNLCGQLKSKGLPDCLVMTQ